jgi:hypothetical protein
LQAGRIEQVAEEAVELPGLSQNRGDHMLVIGLAPLQQLGIRLDRGQRITQLVGDLLQGRVLPMLRGRALGAVH